MSPYNVNSNGNANVFRVNSNGNLDAPNVNNTNGVRPVINLRSDIAISSGNGTSSNPYVI